MAALFNVIESWLSSRATNETRGGVLAGYGIFAWLAAGLGYFLVNSYPAAGIEHLILSAVLLSISVVPVVLTRVAAPDTAQAQPLSLGDSISCRRWSSALRRRAEGRRVHGHGRDLRQRCRDVTTADLHAAGARDLRRHAAAMAAGPAVRPL
jgi:hypothetical protein